MKRIVIFLLSLAMLLPFAACQPKSEEAVAVPTDTERLVNVAMPAAGIDSAPAAEPMPQEPSIEYAEEPYAFSSTASVNGGRLNVRADATVRFPKTLQLPVARVHAIGFPQEVANAYLAYFFAGEQPYDCSVPRPTTREVLQEQIADWEAMIANGTTEEQKLTSEAEAIQLVAEWKEALATAPETIPPYALSDGIMKPGVWGHGDDINEPTLELEVGIGDNATRERLYIVTPVNMDEHSEARLFFDKDHDRFYEATETRLAPGTSIGGMRFNWDEAVALCEEFFAIGGAENLTVGEAFMLEKNGNRAYRLHFVHSVAGVPVAVNREIVRYRMSNDIQWSYEHMIVIVDDTGIYDAAWESPTQVTELVNPAADAMPFAQAAAAFEAMVAEPYARYVGADEDFYITVDNILLSLVRIRDASTKEKVGLYVPAWVFYGKAMHEDSPLKNWEPQIVFAVNAIDGSVIDMERGY